jgi:hypothetical protein
VRRRGEIVQGVLVCHRAALLQRLVIRVFRPRRSLAVVATGGNDSCLFVPCGTFAWRACANSVDSAQAAASCAAVLPKGGMPAYFVVRNMMFFSFIFY